MDTIQEYFEKFAASSGLTPEEKLALIPAYYAGALAMLYLIEENSLRHLKFREELYKEIEEFNKQRKRAAK